jgi:lysozyme
MKVNAAGLDLIKSFEGLRLKAYKCSAGVDTIGYGHTSAAGAPVVKAGMKITEQEAEKILARDLGKYEQAVDKAVTVKPTSNQFSAMVSLCYNIGPGNFAGSSVVRRLNAGDVKGAAEAFLLWNKVHGRALAGLTRRREAERKLFLTPE